MKSPCAVTKVSPIVQEGLWRTDRFAKGARYNATAFAPCSPEPRPAESTFLTSGLFNIIDPKRVRKVDFRISLRASGENR